MAKRRVFSIDVVESMEFLRLSKEAQLLYFFLMLHTDDEGVIINHEVVVKITDSSLKALEELTESGMLIKVDKVYIIRHWHKQNKIAPSKITPSLYQAEISKLSVNQLKEYVLTK